MPTQRGPRTSHTERAMLGDKRPTGRDFEHGGGLRSVGKATDDQRRKAQRNLEGFAHEQEDPEAWLREMLGALGLTVRLP